MILRSSFFSFSRAKTFDGQLIRKRISDSLDFLSIYACFPVKRVGG